GAPGRDVGGGHGQAEGGWRMASRPRGSPPQKFWLFPRPRRRKLVPSNAHTTPLRLRPPSKSVWSDASRGREVVVVLAKRMQPRKMGWLEERHRLNQRYYRGEIDIDTYLRELAKI